MKASRSELKSIIKECLLEILNEGLGANPQINNKIQRPLPQPLFTESSRRNQQSNRRPTASSMPSPQLREAVRAEAGGNKVMEAILADTAASTLPKMLQNEGKAPMNVPGGLAEQVVASADPDQIFGEEVTSKWANLAFMSPTTKK